MSEISALAPPAAPQASAATNVMAFIHTRRAAASTAVDAVRAAAREDPRAALRQAHAERDAATTDIARLSDTLARARQHLSVIEGRHSAAEAAARQVDSAAAEGLIAALAAGASPVAVVDDSEAAKAARLARETEIAGNAVNRLATELSDAEERKRVATWRVRALALAVLEMYGVEIAETMLVEQQEMRRRRDRLGDLQTLLSSEGRLIYGDAVAPPATISSAVSAIDPPRPWRSSSPYAPRQAEAPNPWSGLFQALLEDAEAEIG